jgi:hypothetical protein
MMPLLTGVKMAGFTRGPGFEIKIFQKNYFPQNFTLYLIFYPVFSLQNPAVPGCSTQILPPFRLVVPAFTGYFSLKIFLDHHCSSSPCCKGWAQMTKKVPHTQPRPSQPHSKPVLATEKNGLLNRLPAKVIFSSFD